MYTFNSMLPAKNSNMAKLRLLLWKNMHLQLAHKVQTFFLIALPILFAILATLLGTLTKGEPVPIPEEHGPLFDTTTTKVPVGEIYYSPKNNVLDGIVKQVAAELKANGSTAYDDAEDLEIALVEHDAFVGIEFENGLSDISQLPDRIIIALRFPKHFRSDQLQTWRTNQIYKSNRLVSIGEAGGSYADEGFLAVQAKLSHALIAAKAKAGVTIPSVSMQPFPRRAYLSYIILSLAITFAIVFIFFGYVHPCTCITQEILLEKERQLKEIMKIMGLQNWLQWLAWFIKSYVLLEIPVLVIVILWCGLGQLSLFKHTGFYILLLILGIYIGYVICFAFLISAFFSRALMGGVVASMAYGATILFYFGSDQIWGWSTLTEICNCFFLNSALVKVLYRVHELEVRGEGMTIVKMFRCLSADEYVATMVILIFMLISSALHLALCLYIEQIYPGEYGVARKWYFPFTREFWCPKRKRYASGAEIDEEAVGRGPNFEAEPRNKSVVVEAQKLRKVFGKREAVRDFTLNFYEDEITVILGHNGAGKTTTFMMLAGMYAPTSGHAIVNGYDMAKSPQMARQSLSICPQHNVLFEELNVRHHIQFFSQLKGLKKHAIAGEVDHYLTKLNLLNKETTRVSALSGGMKRKLSLCCALCGNTKVVFCDEPSAGLDPSARRDLWGLLQGEKEGRCILLTTHYMDEAEVLADRIAIMCNGELHGYGTMFFLQQSLSAGYRLVCVQLEGCDVNEVTKFFKKYIKNIELESTVGSDLTYLLPVRHTSKFHVMFKQLEDKLAELKLSGFGINASTLADIFMKIGAESQQAKQQQKPTTYAGRSSGGTSETGVLESTNDSKEQSCSVKCCNHWIAMLHKKMLYTWRNKWLFALIILLPLLLYLLQTLLYAIKSESANDEPLKIDMSKYSDGVVLLDEKGKANLAKRLAARYESLVKSGAELRLTKGESVDNFLLHKDDAEDQATIDKIYLAAATIEDDKIIAWKNNHLFHSAPLSLNLAYNAIAQVLVAESMEIEITNKPRDDSVLKAIKEKAMDDTMKTTGLVCYLSLATAVFALLPVGERVSHMKMQQLISGVHLSTFWLSHLLCDYLVYWLMVLVLLIVLNSQAMIVLFYILVLLLCFGLSALPLTYLMSFMFSEPASAMSYICTINLMIGIPIYMVITSMQINETAKLIHKILMVYPHYALAFGATHIFQIGAEIENCKGQDKEAICAQFNLCCEPAPLYHWVELHYLLITALVFIIILLFSVHLRRLRYLLPIGAKIEDSKHVDEDVKREQKHVQNMSKQEIKEHALVLDRVVKRYGFKFVAVRGISLAVKPYECFGLLGLNGAGKSSTFNMIVGANSISAGNIYIKGFSMKSKKREGFNHMGYCPQVDAIFNFMTGRETLKMICLLNGIRKERIATVTEQLAFHFKFTKHLDKQARHYSGGTKRKLNTAIAALGLSLVCLDEPTAGIDPGATREIWSVLQRMRDLGKALVLTSHSMEECEALCSRLAIMVNGEFRALGSLQHLKNRFNKGMIIKIRVGTAQEITQASRANYLAIIEKGEQTSSSDKGQSTSTSTEGVTGGYETPTRKPPPPAPAPPAVKPPIKRPTGATTSDEPSDIEEPRSKKVSVKPADVGYKKKRAKPKEDKVEEVKPVEVKPVEVKPEVKPEPEVKKQSSTDTDSITKANDSDSKVRTTFYRNEDYDVLIEQVEKRFRDKFPQTIITERYPYRGMLTLQIPDKELKWSTIFGFIEGHRNKLQIMNYSISQTTLEEVFLDFAKNQRHSEIV